MEEGKKLGLAINFHAEELNNIGGAEMGAAIGARAMSHLEHISDEGIKAMATSGTTAVLLPSTAFILRLTPPPAKKMIKSGERPTTFSTELMMNSKLSHSKTLMTQGGEGGNSVLMFALNHMCVVDSRGQIAELVLVKAI